MRNEDKYAMLPDFNEDDMEQEAAYAYFSKIENMINNASISELRKEEYDRRLNNSETMNDLEQLAIELDDLQPTPRDNSQKSINKHLDRFI